MWVASSISWFSSMFNLIPYFQLPHFTAWLNDYLITFMNVYLILPLSSRVVQVGVAPVIVDPLLCLLIHPVQLIGAALHVVSQAQQVALASTRVGLSQKEIIKKQLHHLFQLHHHNPGAIFRQHLTEAILASKYRYCESAHESKCLHNVVYACKELTVQSNRAIVGAKKRKASKKGLQAGLRRAMQV